jgi:hypothetical protein
MLLTTAKNLLLILSLAVISPSVALSKTTGFLIPGYTMSGDKRGYEVSLIIDQGGVGLGFVTGETTYPERERFIEVQASAWAWLVAAGSIGIGPYNSPETLGLQTTVALQFFTPFLAFARLKFQTSPDSAVLPVFGLMFKLPIPISPI